MKTLRFKVQAGGGSGAFSRSWKSEELVDEMLDDLGTGVITQHEALEEALTAAREEPLNLELQNFVAGRYWALEMKAEADAVWKAAFDNAMGVVPSTFDGTIDWGDINNRPFLRIAHGLLLGMMERRDGKAAKKLCDQLMKWSPGDNLGVRSFQGHIFEMLGKVEKAYAHYLEEAPLWPVYWYKAALLSFRRGKFVEACTELRRGFLGNVYVAEGLLGRSAFRQHLVWVGSSLEGPEEAIDFLRQHAQDFVAEEVDFVDWAFNCSHVMRERTLKAEFDEKMTYMQPGKERSAAIEAYRLTEMRFDDTVSKKMVRKQVNRWGDECWPWDRASMNSPRRNRGENQASGRSGSFAH